MCLTGGVGNSPFSTGWIGGIGGIGGGAAPGRPVTPTMLRTPNQAAPQAMAREPDRVRLTQQDNPQQRGQTQLKPVLLGD